MNTVTVTDLCTLIHAGPVLWTLTLAMRSSASREPVARALSALRRATVTLLAWLFPRSP